MSYSYRSNPRYPYLNDPQWVEKRDALLPPDKILVKINDVVYLFSLDGHRTNPIDVAHMSHVVIWFNNDFSLILPAAKNRTGEEINAKDLRELIPNHPKLKALIMEEALK